MTESNSVTMVLVEYSVYTNLKKTQEEYRKLVAKNATLKTSSSAQEEVKANSESEELKDNPESEELKGHGYSVSVAEPMPEKFVQKDYIGDLVSLCSKRHQSSARKLVQDLEKKDSFNWCSDSGNFFLKKQKTATGKLKEVIPKVFTGLRSGKVSGEEDFIKFLKEEELGQYIKSVKADNWFYIGT